MPISLSGSLIITGSITAQSITGSISGSLVGNASSASFAQTASSADNFVVRQGLTGSNALFTGAITAQTLVVQTVTSSVVYSSGSNRFGNQLTDVQQMTGSLRVTGSGDHWVIGGNVGIGTASPSQLLHVNGLSFFGSDIFTYNNGGIFFSGNSSYTSGIFQNANGLQIQSGGTPRISIPSGGNVGIGTATPNYLLSLYDSSIPRIHLINSTTGTTTGDGFHFYQSGVDTYFINKESTGFIYFGTNNAQSITLDSSGNLGLGVTPSAWSGITAFQVGNGASLSGYQVDEALLSANTYYNSGFKYAGTGYATQYQQQTGVHKWYIAPSGTATQPITFTQAMTLDSSGRLGIGTTSPNSRLSINGGDIEFNRGTGALGNYYVRLNKGTSNDGGILLSTDNALDWQIANPAGNLVIYSYGTSAAAMYILRASGNVGIGTTSPNYKLEVIQSSTNGFRLQTAASTVGNPQIDLYDTSRAQETVISSTDGTTTGTYIASYSNHPLLFGTNAGSAPTAKMIITSGGNVGISETNPIYKLQVAGDIVNSTSVNTTGDPGIQLGDGHRLGFNQSGTRSWTIKPTGGNLQFFSGDNLGNHIFSANAVGIGTTSPSQKLHIFNGNLLINNNASGDTNSGIRILAPIATTHVNWMLAAQQNVASAFEITPSTAAGGTTFSTPTAVFTSTGNVGIGTTSPASLLTLAKAAGNSMLQLINSDESAFSLKIYNSGSAATGTRTFIQYLDYSSIVNGYVAFHRGSSSNDGYLSFGDNNRENLRIAYGGNVGIGTTSPSFKTDIWGASLGTAANDYQGDLLLYNPVGNNSYLEIGNFRGAAGSDWTTTGMRFQARIDSTWMGWMQFNGNGNTYGITWGVGGSSVSRQAIGEAMRLANGGNLGIGTTSPGAKLDVAGVTRTYALSDPNWYRITNPEGAAYINSAGTVTGAFKIKLPTAKNNSSTMMRMTVKIYTYSTGLSYTFDIGGYNYSAGDWYNIFATQTGDGGSSAFTVRFGYDGTGECIWIGETNTSWSYPQVYVTDFQAGYSGIDSGWATGWAISLVTSFDTVEQSRAASLLYGTNNFGTGTANYVTRWTSGTTVSTGVLYDNGTNVGIGTTSLSYKLDVSGDARTTGATYLATSTGNVGIGTTSAGGKLTVNGSVVANNPNDGATGEGIIAGTSLKIDASGTGQSAKLYVVSKVLSDTYASGLVAQWANQADDKGFGFNLTTGGAYEVYTKNVSWVLGAYITQGGTTWTNASDATLKTVIGPYEGVLGKFLNLNPVRYTWKHDKTNKECIGLIAQEVHKLFPEVVDDTREKWGIRYTEFVPIMIKAIQEQQAQIEALKAEIAQLKSN